MDSRAYLFVWQPFQSQVGDSIVEGAADRLLTTDVDPARDLFGPALRGVESSSWRKALSAEDRSSVLDRVTERPICMQSIIQWISHETTCSTR